MDKCIETEEVDNNGTPYTTHITYNYEFIDDFDDKPQLDRLGNFLIKALLQYYKSDSKQKDVPLVMLNHLQLENGDQNVLASSTLPTVIPKQAPATSPVENWGPKVYDKDNHTMTSMVRDSVRTDIHFPHLKVLLLK